MNTTKAFLAFRVIIQLFGSYKDHCLLQFPFYSLCLIHCLFKKISKRELYLLKTNHF